MDNTPKCPKCASEFTYAEGDNFVCPDCGHEWSKHDAVAPVVDENAPKVFKDAHGAILQDGDTVTLIKDLKLKGAARDLKAGTKVKNIRLTDGDHDIDCKIEGIGAVQLKTCFVKKS
jgi:protein PhnA